MAKLKTKMPASKPAARDWRAAAIPSAGDSASEWQVKLKLPILSKPRIHKKYKEPWRQNLRRSRPTYGPGEVGGYDAGPGPEQSRALDFLVAREADIYQTLLRAIAKDARETRSYRDPEDFDDPPGLDAVLPAKMTPEQVADRIEFTRVVITPVSLNGIAHVEYWGECAWDADHGFVVVLHKRRVVGVHQQGAGWTDDRIPKPPRRQSKAKKQSSSPVKSDVKSPRR